MSRKNGAVQKSSNLTSREEMRDKLQTLSGLIANSGIQVKPWADPELPHFCALDSVRQTRVLHEIQNGIDLLEGSLKDGHSLLDSRQLLWRSLRHFGWTPNSDVFDFISDEDTVEVYSLDQIQTFRNLQFFRHISFTLEQIHTQPWFQLTRRQPAAEAAIAAAAAKIIRDGVKITLDLSDVPEHIAEEIGSLQELRFHIQMRCLSPVFHDGEIAAVIAVNRTRGAN